MVGFETETWVSNKHNKRAMVLTELLKLTVFTAIQEEDVQAKTEENWFLNNMDERDYMQWINHGTMPLFQPHLNEWP